MSIRTFEFQSWDSYRFLLQFLGIKIGYPLLLYLFVIAMETCSYFIKRAMSDGFIFPKRSQVSNKGREVDIFYSLFVDNIDYLSVFS